MRTPAALLLIGLALACNNPESGTPTATTAPSYAAATVEQFNAPFTLFPDFEAGRVFSLGIVTPIEALCTGAEPVFDAHVRQQFVINGTVHRLLVSGPATLVIYGRAPEDPCDLTSADILFQGKGQLTVNSNDAEGTSSAGTSFGYRVTGIGTTPDGHRARAHVVLRVVFTASGAVKVTKDTFEVTPIGQ